MNVRLLSKLSAQGGDANCCTWSPDGEFLCSCHGDGSLRVWKKPYKTATIIRAHAKHCNACCYSPLANLVATVSSDATIKLWNADSWKTVGEFSSHHDGAVRWCCFSPDGSLLATASTDCSVRVWSVGHLATSPVPSEPISTLTVLQKHAGSVMCCVFAPCGWVLITGGADGELIVFNAFTGKSMARSVPVTSAINCVTIDQQRSDQEQVYFAFAGENTVFLWKIVIRGQDSVSLKQLAELHEHALAVYSIAFHPSAPLMASGSADNSIIIWDLDTYSPQQSLIAHSRYVTHCIFSPDGQLLATSSNDQSINLWKVHVGRHDVSADALKGSTSDDKSVQPLDKAWSVDDVCQWLGALSEQPKSHPDDLKAVKDLQVYIQKVNKDDDSAIPEELKCPITCEIMKDPVVASDGYSYERGAMLQWYSKGRRSSPVTNLPLSSTLLVPNHSLKALIQYFRNKATS